MVLILITIYAITFSSLRITAIYNNRVILYTLLLAGVLTGWLLTGLSEGAIEGLSQVTTEQFCEGLPVFSTAISEVHAIAEYVYCSILSKYTVLCEGAELPVVMQFENLNVKDNFASAINSLKELAGIYAIKCTLTGAIYVGSSTDLGERIRDHF